MVQGGMSIVKYILFAFNLIFVIFGILLIYSAIKASVTLSQWNIIIRESPNASAITLAVVGFIIFFIAFLGCCGAIKENSCMLVTFGTIILLLLFIEIILGALILSSKSELKKTIETEIETIIKDYNPSNETAQALAIDDLQSYFGCCGSKEPQDWDKNNYTQKEGKYPASCCNKPDIQEKFCPKDKAYKVGCIGKLEDALSKAVNFVGGIALAIAGIQLLGVIFSCCLGRAIRKEYEVV